MIFYLSFNLEFLFHFHKTIEKGVFYNNYFNQAIVITEVNKSILIAFTTTLTNLKYKFFLYTFKSFIK